MLTNVAFILPVVALMIYFIGAAIAFGASIVQYNPKLIGDRSAVRRYLHPSWEIPILMVVGLVAYLVMVYPGSLVIMKAPLLVILGLSSLTLVARVVIKLVLVRRGIGPGPRKINLLFLVASFAMPLLLSQMLVLGLGGTLGVTSAASWLMGALALVVTASSSLTFFSAISPPHGRVARRRLRNIQHYLAITLVALVTFVLPPVLATIRPTLMSPNMVLVLMVLSVVMGFGYVIAEHNEQFLAQWGMVTSYVIIVIALIISEELPNIFYPNLATDSGWLGTVNVNSLILVAAPELLIIALALIWLRSVLTASVLD